jgi:two-component system, cell cycle sensor histidine kinase and response regulator CckA
MPIFGVQPAGLLDRVLEQVGVAAAVIDNQHRLVFANKTAIDIFGGAADDSPLTFDKWRRQYRVEDSRGNELPLEKSAVIRALRGEHIESEEVRATFPDGSTKWLLTWAYPFSVMGLAGVLAFVIDETRDVELRRAASQLERMETLAVLAAGLAHDFNNVLDTISLGLASLLSEANIRKDLQPRLDQLLEATSRASRLVKKLMQFSRIQDLDCRPVSINDVVADVLRLVRPLLRQNILLKIDLDDELPYILADPSQIEQVLVNLIVNAIDAMPNGGQLQLSTALEAGPDTADESTEHEFVQISVADTGIGIAPELQPHIFEPFFTTKPPGKGTGLGLSSVYGIVKQHKASISVCSEPGAGAAFIVSFPVPKSVATSDFSQ